MTVKIEVTEGERWKRTLKIEVPLEEVKAKFADIYKTIRAEARIPGFRPGKAPMSTVKSRFSELASQEAFEKLMDESYRQAIGDSGLQPIGEPEIKEIDFAEDKPLTYIAEFDIHPEIEVEHAKGFHLKRPSDKVTEGEVKSMMEYIQHKHSELVAVERPAREGDFVFLDLEVVFESSGELEEREFKNVQVELMEGELGSQFLSALAGKEVGVEVEFDVTYPRDHFDKRFAGFTVRYKAKVQAVKELHLVEFDEEFFKQFGDEVHTLDQFKEKLRQDIYATKKKQADDQLKEEAIKAVIDKNRFELPESMLRSFLDHVVEDFRQSSSDIEVEEDEIRRNYRALAIRRIRWNLLMHRIAEDEKIRVNKSDLDAWLQRFADNYNMTLEEARKQVASNQQVADLRETILETKVLEFIIANSTVESIETPSFQPGSE